MKTSRRAAATPAPPISVFHDAIARTRKHADPIDLCQAAPSWAPPAAATEALAAAAGDDRSARYTQDPGLAELREATAAWLTRRHGARIEAEQVMITAGANAAFHLTAPALFDAGESVHLMAPYYFNHAMSVRLLGGDPRTIPTTSARPWARSPGAASAGVPDGGLLVVVNPDNPSGRCLARAEIEALFEWATAHDVRLVIDETYLEFFPLDAEPVTALALPHWHERAVVVGTFSKSLSMPGYRVGWVAATPSVLAEVLKAQDTGVVCASHPGQRAVLAALGDASLDKWLAAKRVEIDGRVRAFCEAMGAQDGPFLVDSAGAFFAWVRTNDPASIDFSDLAVALACDTGVLCLPGEAFGSAERGTLRIAVGNESQDRLREAAQRLQAFRGSR